MRGNIAAVELDTRRDRRIPRSASVLVDTWLSPNEMDRGSKPSRTSLNFCNSPLHRPTQELSPLPAGLKRLENRRAGRRYARCGPPAEIGRRAARIRAFQERRRPLAPILAARFQPWRIPRTTTALPPG